MTTFDNQPPMALQRGAVSRSSTCSNLSTTSTLVDVTLTVEHLPKGELFTPTFPHDYIKTTLQDNCQTCDLPFPAFTHPTENLDTEPKEGTNLPLKPITEPTRAFITTQLSLLLTPPKIIGLLASEKSGSRLYAQSTAKSCDGKFNYQLLNIVSECDHLEQQGDERDKFMLIKNRIEGLNSDMSVTGLIVYFPIFGDARDDAIRSLVDSRIDIEGVSPGSLLRSYRIAPPVLTESYQDQIVYPCTPLAVIQLLHSVSGLYDKSAIRGQRLQGKVITVVNRSETVGRPLAAMLANDGATVFSTDINGTHILQRHDPSKLGFCTRSIIPSSVHDPETYYSMSDIIISAVPSDTFKIPTSTIKPGAICINIAGQNNFQDDVKSRASGFALRVGGITTLMLQLNALILRSQM